MIHAEVPRRRPWVAIIWLVAVAFGALLAALQLYTALLIVLSGALAATFITAIRPSMLQAVRPRASTRPSWQPIAQRTIVTADGIERAALLAPVPSESGHTMVLTVEGYKLVDESGRVVYALKR